MASLIVMQRSVRITLGLAGLLLVLAALVGWRMSADMPSGDIEVAERLLVPPAADTTTTTTPRTSTTGAVPLWQANEESLLVDVDPGDGPTPVRLIVDKLEIDAPIGAYGVDSQGRMAVPDNVTDVGWYQFGPSPGEDGSAVLAAHVDLAGPGRGLFFDLDQLEDGDRIVVILSDGDTNTFEVIAQTTYLKSELPLDVIFSREGAPVLTLVTCGGGFSRSSRSYDSNVVVYAIPVT